MSNSAQRYGKTHRKGRQDKHQDREFRGIVQEVENAKSSNEKYNLAWFKPVGRQQDIVDAIDQYDWVGIQAPSGTGKTTTVVWKALSLLGKGYRKIVFVKNPTEVGTDMLGYLTGDKNDKMQAHFEAMRGVFLAFMNKGKLESDEKNGNIVFNIPNYLLGATISDAVVVLDECQTYSPSTLKLLMERVDDSCKLLILGDRQQAYSIKHREDGFTDFLNRVTDVDDKGRYSVEPLFKYVELTTNENKRGAISKRVTEIYSK
jgi:predicted ribonuclease YlaK